MLRPILRVFIILIVTSNFNISSWKIITILNIIKVINIISIDDAIIRDKIEWYRWKQKQFNVDYSDCISLYKNYSTDKKV